MRKPASEGQLRAGETRKEDSMSDQHGTTRGDGFSFYAEPSEPAPGVHVGLGERDEKPHIAVIGEADLSVEHAASLVAHLSHLIAQAVAE